MDGITQWLSRWKRNGWKTADKKPVKNQDLWELLDLEAAKHSIEWHWVKGHAGVPGNERCDALANAAIDAMLAPQPAPHAPLEGPPADRGSADRG